MSWCRAAPPPSRQTLTLHAAHVAAILDVVNGLANTPVRADPGSDIGGGAVAAVHTQLYRLVHAALKQRSDAVANVVPALAQAVLRTRWRSLPGSTLAARARS